MSNFFIAISSSSFYFGRFISVVKALFRGLECPKLQIGIPLNEKRAMEFIKQIIDLGGLFNIANDVVDLRDTFMNTIKQENSFRGASYTPDEVIEDILDMAFKYSQTLLKGSDNSFPEIKYITDGLRKIVNHLKKRMDQKDAKIVLAKIVYMTHVIRNSHATRLVKEADFAAVKNLRLEGKYKILEGLKKTNPEAYFYWHQTTHP